MFERFTDRAREVVVGAQREAFELNHNYIGTEHILLGLLRIGNGIGFEILDEFEVGIEETRQRVEQIIGRGDGRPASHIPFTPRAKKVLELSFRQAKRAGDGQVGTDHIVLALLQEGDGVAAQILRERGVTLDAAKDRQRDLLRDDGVDPGEELPGFGEA
jgi:ATP-dependent Clp protease ATP-binding subunit ClpC